MIEYQDKEESAGLFRGFNYTKTVLMFLKYFVSFKR